LRNNPIRPSCAAPGVRGQGVWVVNGLAFHGQAQNKSSTDLNFYNPLDTFFCHTVCEGFQADDLIGWCDSPSPSTVKQG
jgi:hypothetical protein